MNYRKGLLRVYLVASVCWIAAWVYTGVAKSPDLQLSAAKRQELDAIVRQMMDDDESDDDIQPVVDDFKQKYGKRSWGGTLRRVATSGEIMAIAFVPPLLGGVAFVVVPWVGRGFRTSRS